MSGNRVSHMRLPPTGVAGDAGQVSKDGLVTRLARHSQSDKLLLQSWMVKYEMGLLPYAGAWRTRKEIGRLRRHARRRSWVILFETLGALTFLLALDLLLFLIVWQLIGPV